jgi:chorismate dehydratase
MTPIRLGAVGYLNARPLVFGLDHDPRFEVRYDIPVECARLLHAREIDLGLVPSIEFLRGPKPYVLVPGPAVTSSGLVASVAIYTRRDPQDIRSIATDSSSRTSVALATILMRRVYGVTAETVSMAPDLGPMLERADAALIIGDRALFLDAEPTVRKIDLGALWTSHTGLPFVYAFWTGWAGAASPEDVERLQQARDEGVRHVHDIAAAHFPEDLSRQRVVSGYLQDNIQYYLGQEQLEGLKTFFRYATELRLASFDGTLRFYHAAHNGAR